MNDGFSDQIRNRSGLWADTGLIAGLVALDVAARLLPHAPNFTPIAASALFAGTVLNRRGLAIFVPLLAMLISDAIIGRDRALMMFVVYTLFMLPAMIAYLPARLRAPGMYLPVMIGFSLLFFVVTNFAVWLDGGLYPRTLGGLATCFVAALPYLHQTVIGDLFWAAVLFGGASLVQAMPALARRKA